MINIFQNYRQTIGVVMLVFGYPLLFFVRDKMELAPGNSNFTWLFFGFFALLTFTKKNFKGVFVFKKEIFLPFVLFWSWVLLYRLIAYFFSKNIEQVNAAIDIREISIFAFVYVLGGIDKDKFFSSCLIVLIIVILLSNLAFIYSFLTNPIDLRGRVSITSNKGAGGNEMLSPRLAMFGCVAGICAFSRASFIVKITIILLFLTAIPVLVLGGSRSSILLIGIVLIIDIFSMFFKKKTYRIHKFTVRKSFFLFLFLFFIGSFSVYKNSSYDIVRKFEGNANFVFGSLQNIYNSLTTQEKEKQNKTKKISVDPSTEGHLSGLWASVEEWKNNYFILFFGQGYKYRYVDIPYVQSLNDLGVVGFIFYTYFLFSLLRGAVKANKNIPINRFNIYYVLAVMLTSFTAGEPYAPLRWQEFLFVVIIIEAQPKKNNIT